MTLTGTRAPRAARLSDVALPPVDPSTPPWPGRTVRLAEHDVYVRTTPGPESGGEIGRASCRERVSSVV